MPRADFSAPLVRQLRGYKDATTDAALDKNFGKLSGTTDKQPEIAAIKKWLKREGTCLMCAPHHDVGFTPDVKQRQMEYEHHRDALVPRQQRFSQYTRSLMKGLGIPVWNEWGLRPAVIKGTKEIAPLTTFRDIDKKAPGVYGMARQRWNENHVFTRFVRNLYFPYKPLAGPKMSGTGGPNPQV